MANWFGDGREPHCRCSRWNHAFVEAGAQLLAITPAAHQLEVLDKATPILQRPAPTENGMVTPQGPGLGMEWDEAAVERYGA